VYAARRLAKFAAVVLLAQAVLAIPARPATSSNAVYVVDIKGAIGVATARHIDRALARAATDKAALVVLRIDTPGGLVSSTREIIRSIIASPVPIAVYVAPGGARAASAGTYITYAANVAAMAPGTNLGAATPVSLSGPGMPSPAPAQHPEESKPGDKKPGKAPPDAKAPAPGTAEERKSLNDAIAFIRSLAQLRGRNAAWAEDAVRDAATLTAQDALKAHVIDIVAGDMTDLLTQLDGRRVTVGGIEQRLATKGAAVTEVPTDSWTETLAVILLLAGIYGLGFEFISPGMVLPGIIGGISLLLALAALSVLPVNYAGLGLILLGLALMAGEAVTPGTIALGIGGVVAFVAGTLFLFEPGQGGGPDLAVAWPVLAGAVVVSAGFLLLVVGAAFRVRRRAVVGGAEEMINSPARIVDWQGGAGHVRLRGELWSARADRSFEPGDAVRVVRRDGLKLIVEPDREGNQP
jgi:membrane-bound serine protease (ClpP class)